MTEHRKRYLPAIFNPRNDPRWLQPGSYPILPPGLVFPADSPAWPDRWSWLALAVMADCSGRGVLDVDEFKRQSRWGASDAEVEQSARRPIHRLVCAGLATTYVVDGVEFFELPWGMYSHEAYGPDVDVDAKRWPSWIPAPRDGELTDGMGGNTYWAYSSDDHPEQWRKRRAGRGIPDSELTELDRKRIDYITGARQRQWHEFVHGIREKHLASDRVEIDTDFEKRYITPLAEQPGRKVWAYRDHELAEPPAEKKREEAPKEERPARESPPVGGPEQEGLFEISNESKEGGEKSA